MQMTDKYRSLSDKYTNDISNQISLIYFIGKCWLKANILNNFRLYYIVPLHALKDNASVACSAINDLCASYISPKFNHQELLPCQRHTFA